MKDKQKIQILKEALEFIAWLDEPAASTTQYWSNCGYIAATVAMDTRIARRALKQIETGSQPAEKK